MNWKNIFLLLLFPLLIGSGCNRSLIKGPALKEDFFISKWQSLNDSDFLIEFNDSSYQLYRKQELFYEFKYTIIPGNKCFELELYDQNEPKPALASIQIVDHNRIRIFYWKHHHILDLADEFYRTDLPDDFDRIMQRILETDN